MQSYNFTILLSLINLGFFGGFTHCSGMCGPFVLTQVSNRLRDIPLNKFSQFERLKNFALLPYHLGRITTYSLIGLFCSAITKNLRDSAAFNYICATLLLFAVLFFLQNLFEKKLFSFQFRLPKIKNPLILNGLFKNPRGLNGFFLGTILGFIPCGLLYGAFALAASIANPILAAFGMFLFGIATFPALFFSACGGYFFLKFVGDNFKLISKIIITINIITLLAMALGLIIR